MDENSETENERKYEIEDISINQCDTPLEISCEPPVEDTLVLSPLSPMKLEFSQHEPTCRIEPGDSMILEEASTNETNVKFVDEIDPIKCPNCYESIMKWDHVCNDDTQSSDTINDDIANDSAPASNDDDTCEKMPKTIGAILEKMLDVKLPP